MTNPPLPADPMFATEIATAPSAEADADPRRESDPSVAPVGDEPSDPPAAATDSDGEKPDDDETPIDEIIAAVKGFIEEKPFLSIAIAGTAGLGAFAVFQSVFLRPRIRQYRR